MLQRFQSPKVLENVGKCSVYTIGFMVCPDLVVVHESQFVKFIDVKLIYRVTSLGTCERRLTSSYAMHIHI